LAVSPQKLKVSFTTLGNDFARRVFSSIVGKEAYAPFYLLEGPEGVGKASLAHQVVAAALCEEENVPCGICPSCTRVRNFQHPDFIVILPEKATLEPGSGHIRPADFSRNQKITIAQVRTIQSEADKPPMEGPRRFVAILDGELMTPEAQNAFLKTLEEPGEAKGSRGSRNVFLMVSAAPNLLPTTILSRARRIRFYSLSLEDFARYDFGERLSVPVPVLHRLSEGSIGRARALLGPEIQHFRKLAVALLSGDTGALATIVATVGRNRDSAEGFLTVYCSFLRDAIVLARGAPEIVVNLDMREDIEGISRKYPVASLENLLRGARGAEEAILERYIPAETALLAGIREMFPRSFHDTVTP